MIPAEVCPPCADTDCRTCTGDPCECACDCGHPCPNCDYAGPGLCPCDAGIDLMRGA